MEQNANFWAERTKLYFKYNYADVVQAVCTHINCTAPMNIYTMPNLTTLGDNIYIYKYDQNIQFWIMVQPQADLRDEHGRIYCSELRKERQHLLEFQALKAQISNKKYAPKFISIRDVMN